MLKHVIYVNKTGYSTSDCDAEKVAREFLEDKNIEILKTSSEIVILALRVLLLEGVFSIDKFTIHYLGEVIPMEPDGSISYWPEGFCDCIRGLFSRLFIQKYEK